VRRRVPESRRPKHATEFTDELTECSTHLCEHASWAPRAHLDAAFRRALDKRNLALAIAEARDLPVINLADALELLLLIGDHQPERYDRAAARWLARYCLEVPDVDLAEAALTAGALAALAAPEERVGALALVALAHQRRLRDVERVLRRSLSLGSDD
jgi:hypothetical protein